MRPRVDEVVQGSARTVRGPHVTVSLEGVGGTDVAPGKAARDQLLDGVQRRIVGEPVVEVSDHTNGCTFRGTSVSLLHVFG